MEEAAPGLVRLNPLSIQHELRNSSLANVLYQVRRSGRRRFNINFGIGNPVFFEEALRDPAVAAPCCGVDQ